MTVLASVPGRTTPFDHGISAFISDANPVSSASPAGRLVNEEPSNEHLTTQLLSDMTSPVHENRYLGPPSVSHLTPPQIPLRDTHPLTSRPGTPASVVSSSRSLGETNFSSQSFVFHDLHEIEQKLESNYIYAAIEYAFEGKGLTYAKATEFRNKVAVLVDVYGQRFRMQKSMQETVMNQVRYYQEHYEKLYEAETLPWRMRQKLQGLRGDTQRLNDELSKSKLHLTQLEAEILRLEDEKLRLHDTLDTIPTSHEFRHLLTCLHLEQQVIMQQLENYRSLVAKTTEHISNNDTVVASMEKRTGYTLAETEIRRKDLVNVTNTIPYIQKDCSLHAAELSKLGEEIHALTHATQRIQQHAHAGTETIRGLDKECQEVVQLRFACDRELETNLQHYKESIRKLDQAVEADHVAKNEKAAIVEAVQNAETSLRAEATVRLTCFRERDHLSTSKQGLDKNNRKLAQANEIDADVLVRLTRKAHEEEEEAEDRHLRLLKLEQLIHAYSNEAQAKKDDNTRLYRHMRERHKALFMLFMHARKIAKDSRRMNEKIGHMEIAQRAVNVTCDKLSKTVISMKEDLEHKDIAARFAASSLEEKLEKIQTMQTEYYRLDRERQELKDAYRVCQGGLHEHKDRLLYADSELQRVQDDSVTAHRLLDKAQNDRQGMWVALTRIRKDHFSERQKLKDLEATFERGFSKVLILRRDLDVNLLKCETFTETFDLVSELRACEAALLIDITSQYMMKHEEKNQIETATYQTELRHRSLDSYVHWLHKTADTDMKLLYKRLKWHGSLLLQYTSTRDELKAQLVAAVNRRAVLKQQVLQENEKSLSLPVISVPDLQKKEDMLSKMLISMERRFFQLNVRHSLLSAICHAATQQIQMWRDSQTADQQTAMVHRNRVERAKRQHKLAMIDVVVEKTQLCRELVLSDNLQTVRQLTFDKYQLKQLQSGDQLLQVTDGSELLTSEN